MLSMRAIVVVIANQQTPIIVTVNKIFYFCVCMFKESVAIVMCVYGLKWYLCLTYKVIILFHQYSSFLLHIFVGLSILRSTEFLNYPTWEEISTFVVSQKVYSLCAGIVTSRIRKTAFWQDLWYFNNHKKKTLYNLFLVIHPYQKTVFSWCKNDTRRIVIIDISVDRHVIVFLVMGKRAQELRCIFALNI